MVQNIHVIGLELRGFVEDRTGSNRIALRQFSNSQPHESFAVRGINHRLTLKRSNRMGVVIFAIVGNSQKQVCGAKSWLERQGSSKGSDCLVKASLGYAYQTKIQMCFCEDRI